MKQLTSISLNKVLFMAQMPVQVGRIRQQLNGIKAQISYLLLQSSYDEILKSYKTIGRHLAYFLNYFGCPPCSQLLAYLQECMEMLSVLINSSEFEKYGHRFTVLNSVVGKYENLTRRKIDPKKQQILKRIQKNNESPYYKSLKLVQFSKIELSFLGSLRVDTFLLQVTDNQIVLQNNQCICCSQVFIHNYQIMNCNPMISNIIEFGTKGSIDLLILQRFFNSICNQGGGVLLIGAQRSEGVLRPVGIKFKNYQEIYQWEQQITMAFANIKPQCKFLIQRVLVHTNPLTQDNPVNQYLRICFRVFILPQLSYKLSYLQYVKKGCKNTYEAYILNNSSQATRIEPQDIYSVIHKTFRQKRAILNRNSHQWVYCHNPYYQYSYQFVAQASKGQISIEDLYKKEQKEEKCKQKVMVPNDQPKFRYKFTSLMVVASKKGERYVEIFQERLKSNKLICEIGKPFAKSFNQAGGRCIWLISHQGNFSDLKNVMSNCQKDGVIKPGAIKMMSVAKTLQIQTDKLNPSSCKKLKSSVKQRYGKELCWSEGIETENGVQKTMKCLSFDDFSQAIYAFMVLQELQLRAHFVREGPYKFQAPTSSY